jgi:periplasmic protein TonB
MSDPKTWLARSEEIMREHPFVGLLAACLASSLAHGVAYASLALAPRAELAPPPSRVTVRVQTQPKPPEPVKPDPPPEIPKPAQRRERHKTPPPEVEAAPPPEAAPLQGVTLTNESGTGSFNSLVGDGSSFHGPLGPVAPLVAPKPPAPRPSASGPKSAPGVPLVALADLSEKPRPPSLGSALREHYPLDARQRGVGGTATVKARIEPDGRIRKVELVTETFPGFGDACRRTLTGSHWSAPRDREGRAVSTVIRYTCRFVVQP